MGGCEICGLGQCTRPECLTALRIRAAVKAERMRILEMVKDLYCKELMSPGLAELIIELER